MDLVVHTTQTTSSYRVLKYLRVLALNGESLFNELLTTQLRMDACSHQIRRVRGEVTQVTLTDWLRKH